MDEKQREELSAIAAAEGEHRRGRISRRRLLAMIGAAGLGSLGLYAGWRGSRPRTRPGAVALVDELGPQSASVPGTEQHRFLQEVGRRFAGTRLHVVTEHTAPSRAISSLVQREFTPLTGIEVSWELLPLDRVLAMYAADVSRQAGHIDIFYWDQAWLGRFYQESVSVLELFEKKDLAYPGYDFDDILAPLVRHVASYNGYLAGIPYDIPILIMFYRTDVLEELGLAVPRTLAEFLQVAQTIHREKAPAVYGSAGQWKAGHYSLECDMTHWLWSHGGSIFGPAQRPAIGDERAAAAMEYMLELGKFMHPKANTSDWYGQSDCFTRGEAGIMISWGELVPGIAGAPDSRVAGLFDVAPCPAPLALRRPAECSFGETPGVSHQGGSCLALSRYSRHRDAAWLFLQWATSPDITTRACILGGGSSPVRHSNYEDPRIRARARAAEATTRHFGVVKDAIMNHMGTEPQNLPAWASLAVDSFAIELGKMLAGQQGVRVTLDAMARDADRAARGLWPAP